MLQDADGQVTEAHSASAGLDYPGIGPQLAALAEGGRIEVAAATDREAVAAMKTTTRTEGILPALETAHAVAALPKLLAGVGGVGGLVAGRGPRPPRVLRPRRQGPRRARAVRRRRAVGERPVTLAHAGPSRPRPARTATAGARRIAAAFARARTDGRAALIPYVVAGYPDADTSFEIALAAADAGADLLEVGLPYSDPLADGATLQRASGVALAAGATLERSLRLIERIGAARPDLPLVPMGYANQVIGGGDGEAVREAAGRRRCGRADRRRPDARRRRAVRGRRPRRRAGGRLPRRPDDAAGAGARPWRPGAAGSCTASRSSA